MFSCVDGQKKSVGSKGLNSCKVEKQVHDRSKCMKVMVMARESMKDEDIPEEAQPVRLD